MIFLCINARQILNRTNNIFELVTVEPVLTDRLNDRHRNEIFLSDEFETVEDKTLRLKGTLIKIKRSILFCIITYKEVDIDHLFLY